MKRGSLSDHFIGVGTKALKDTEINPQVSRGHELQGVSDFRAFLGTPSVKVTLPVRYAWLDDNEHPSILDSSGTWYDSRRGKTQRAPEFRLYYPKAAEEIIHRSRSGDTLFLCQPREGPLLALFCEQGSSVEQQLLWLFGLQLTSDFKLSQRDLRVSGGRDLDFTARQILELIGIDVFITDESLLELLLGEFGEKFPATRMFSAFARNHASDLDPLNDPDGALLSWMDTEERMFTTLERHIVGKRLQHGFVTDGNADVDDFVQFSLGVQNRRKSRAGWALGNHVEALLQVHQLDFKREATTEKRNGPDFLFPSEEQYHNPGWPADRLLMLAAKTSCKDRWRQVLAEADRIIIKHLLTLEPGISETQTAEMQKSQLNLVVPLSLHESFSSIQQSWLMSVGGFLDRAKFFAKDKKFSFGFDSN